MSSDKDLLKKVVEGAATIGISGHERPDGDCIGSTLGLYNYLKKITPQGTKITVFLNKLGPKYSYLAGYEDVDSEYGAKEPFDVFFSLDSSTLDRLGEAQAYFESAKTTMCIDHHISNLGFGTYQYIDGDASSASELVCRLIPDEELDKDIAVCLYSGIVSDTGVFQFSCTSPETMRIAARLMEFGFDFSDIIHKSYYEKTYLQNQLLGRALLESVRFLDNRAVFSVVTKKTMEFYGATPKDLDGIVNQLLATKGVHCAVFLYECDDLNYKVSMRSDGTVDVARIAVIFGGGGHVRAAGCNMNGTMYDVINNLSVHIEHDLDNSEKNDSL